MFLFCKTTYSVCYIKTNKSSFNENNNAILRYQKILVINKNI